MPCDENVDINSKLDTSGNGGQFTFEPRHDEIERPEKETRGLLPLLGMYTRRGTYLRLDDKQSQASSYASQSRGLFF